MDPLRHIGIPTCMASRRSIIFLEISSLLSRLLYKDIIPKIYRLACNYHLPTITETPEAIYATTEHSLKEHETSPHA